MTRILIRGAFIVALFVAASFKAFGETGDQFEHTTVVTRIIFAESSAELTMAAIGILSNLAKDQRRAQADRIVVYADGGRSSEPVTRLRLSQIRDLLIDLGLPPGRVAIIQPPEGLPMFVTICASSTLGYFRMSCFMSLNNAG